MSLCQCTGRCQAWLELSKKYTIVSQKPRFDSATKDLLVVFRYTTEPGGREFLVELQFHYRSILSLKSFSHAAFVVERLQVRSMRCT